MHVASLAVKRLHWPGGGWGGGGYKGQILLAEAFSHLRMKCMHHSEECNWHRLAEEPPLMFLRDPVSAPHWENNHKFDLQYNHNGAYISAVLPLTCTNKPKWKKIEHQRRWMPCPSLPLELVINYKTNQNQSYTDTHSAAFHEYALICTLKTNGKQHKSFPKRKKCPKAWKGLLPHTSYRQKL